MKTVTIRIVGGLGNQLHGYAFGRALATHQDAILKLDAESGYWNDPYGRIFLLDQFPDWKVQYYRIRSQSRFLRFIFKLGLKVRIFISRLIPIFLKSVVEEGIPTHYQAEILQTRYFTNPYFIGYWASYRYYQGIEEELRQELKPVATTNPSALLLLSQIQSVRSCFIHWRSYKEEDGIQHPCLRAYYRNAINVISDKFQDIVFFVFSDDPVGAKKEVTSMGNKIVYVDLSVARGNLQSLADFYLMYNCNHAIIGDSTFSWWAAWLGDYEGKIIVAPTGFPWGKDWIPPHWISLDITGRNE
jgi:hypothetical protein